MHASKGRKYYACTEKRSQKRREIMVTITRRDLCRLALLSLMVAFDGRSYRPLVLRSVQPGFCDPCVPGAVDAGVWTQHRPHSVRPCGPALLAVVVAEGLPRGGCLPPL